MHRANRPIFRPRGHHRVNKSASAWEGWVHRKDNTHDPRSKNCHTTLPYHPRNSRRTFVGVHLIAIALMIFHVDGFSQALAITDFVLLVLAVVFGVTVVPSCCSGGSLWRSLGLVSGWAPQAETGDRQIRIKSDANLHSLRPA